MMTKKYRSDFFDPNAIPYSSTLYSTLLRQSFLFASIFISLAMPAQSTPAGGDLNVLGNGFAHDRGQAVAKLFRRGDDIFGPPHRQIKAVIRDGQVTLVFRWLPYATYAVILFHDENGNDDIGHNFFRFPAEPLGFSGKFKVSLFSGKPTFDELQFEFGKQSGPLRITVE